MQKEFDSTIESSNEGRPLRAEDTDGSKSETDPQWSSAIRELRRALEQAAQLQQTVTYADAAKAVKSMQLDALSTTLVLLLCELVRDDVDQDAPLLASLVIGKRRNQPGRGFFKYVRRYFHFDDDEIFWLAELQAVYDHYGRRVRRRSAQNGMNHRVALPSSSEQRPEDQSDFIISFFD